MNKAEITRRQFSDRYQSLFSKRYACWANNHRGWAKMKKFNKKLAKKRLRHEQARQLKED